MTKFGIRSAPWAVFSASILIPAYFYSSLPDSILIARSFFGSDAIFAGKSLFTVFRVPLIDLVCAFAVVLLSRAGVSPVNSAAFQAVCSTLLFTAAFKSLFQSLEIISGPEWAAGFFYLTAAIVAAGLLAAIILGRSLIRSFNFREIRLQFPERTGLVILLLAYLGLAVVPVIYFSRT